MKYIYISIGTFFVFLGLVGAFLPLHSTTPFLILATYFFSKSSKPLQIWLLSHKILGPFINDWEKHRVISRPAKILATLCITFSITSLLIKYQLLNIYGLSLFLTGSLLSLYLWSFPSSCPATRNTKETYSEMS